MRDAFAVRERLRDLNGSFARWTGYKLLVAATQQIADWLKKLGMFEYVNHFAQRQHTISGSGLIG
jgi:hypothetical protein